MGLFEKLKKGLKKTKEQYVLKFFDKVVIDHAEACKHPADAADKLIDTAISLIKDSKRLEELHTNILTLAQTDSARRIAEEVINLAKK